MTTTKTKAEPIAIAPPDFWMLQISIRGTAPLVVNRFSQKAMQMMKETQEAGWGLQPLGAKPPTVPAPVLLSVMAELVRREVVG